MNNEIANRLYEAEKNAFPIDAIDSLLSQKTIENAYEIQNINTVRRAQYSKIIGYKIGLTSFAVQKQLGVSQPDFGVLFEDMLHFSEEKIDISGLIQPKIEGEVAVILKHNITQKVNAIEELLQAIDYITPCLEIVDSRVKDWKISIYDTIADNASSAKLIIGKEKFSPQDFHWKNAKMKLYNHQELVSEGVGENCLNHPLFAMQWLVNFLVEKNIILRKGDIILTGALGPMHKVEKADHYKLEISQLGSIWCSMV